jgi:hypothetical protein
MRNEKDLHMLESKLLINRYITFPFNTSVRADCASPGFLKGEPRQYYLKESKGFLKKRSNVVEGFGPKLHRRFLWLPWIPGHITEVPLEGTDVLTGPMSGCKIVIYRRGGKTYVGHIGTDIASVARTAAVKECWNSFAEQSSAEIQGFDPTEAISNFSKSHPSELAGPKIFGLVTARMEMYAVCAYEQGIGSREYRINEVRRVFPLPTSRLRNL